MFGFCFHGRNLKQRLIVGQKDIYRGALEKRISQEDNLIDYFFSVCFLLFAQFVEVFALIFN